MVGEPIEQKHRAPESDDWWNTVEAKAKGKGPEAEAARVALRKHRAKFAAAEAAESERRHRQLDDIANER
jgi:hypothetical protein